VSRSATSIFRSSGQPGHSARILALPGRVSARKRVREVRVEFATAGSEVRTPEGPVHAERGDAILTGSMGERWCVPRTRFNEKYQPAPPTRAGEAGRYLSLPIDIIAVPMHETFEVVLLDGVSRLHGHAGDWLVDYGDGSLGVVAQRIFATTYEITG
jgi:hypothetical protein